MAKQREAADQPTTDDGEAASADGALVPFTLPPTGTYVPVQDQQQLESEATSTAVHEPGQFAQSQLEAAASGEVGDEGLQQPSEGTAAAAAPDAAASTGAERDEPQAASEHMPQGAEATCVKSEAKADSSEPASAEQPPATQVAAQDGQPPAEESAAAEAQPEAVPPQAPQASDVMAAAQQKSSEGAETTAEAAPAAPEDSGDAAEAQAEKPEEAAGAVVKSEAEAGTWSFGNASLVHLHFAVPRAMWEGGRGPGTRVFHSQCHKARVLHQSARE